MRIIRIIRIIRMTQDFKKAKIYKITSDYNDDVYVGSTCDTLQKRFSTHKYSINNKYKQHRPLYALMNEIGFDRFRIDLIEEYPCEDKMALGQWEGFFIRNIGTLNKQIEGRTSAEYKAKWFKENKDRIREYKIKNKEDINEKRRIRRQKKNLDNKKEENE